MQSPSDGNNEDPMFNQHQQIDVDHGSTAHYPFGGDQASEELDGSQAGENREAEFGGPINTIQDDQLNEANEI